jgi:pantetheine-phosphate adenylyltransferase
VGNTGEVTVGLYAGSFDPLHLGHVALITRAARWCETLYVVAAGNPAKRGGLFDRAERRRLIEQSCRHLPGVVALEHGGLLVRLAVDLDVDVLVRGAGKEQGAELQMAVANELAGGPTTVFLPPVGETEWISSSLVRAELGRGAIDDVATMVPPPVAAALRTYSAATASAHR